MIYEYTREDGKKGAIDLSRVASIDWATDRYSIRISTPDGAKYEIINIPISAEEAQKMISSWKDLKEPKLV